MKQAICVVLFFVLFIFLNKIVILLFPIPNLIISLFIWVLFGLVLLVVCKLVYDELERQEKLYLTPKRRAIIVISILIVMASVYGYRYWDDHREKSLAQVIEKYSYPEQIIDHSYNFHSPSIIKDDQDIQELMDFLADYRVKKVNDRGISAPAYSFDWENTKGIFGPNWVMVTIGSEVIRINEDFYQIKNGSIDMDWLEKYVSREFKE